MFGVLQLHPKRRQSIIFGKVRCCDGREGNNSEGVEDLCLTNGSGQGQNLALTVLFVPKSLDSGSRDAPESAPVIFSAAQTFKVLQGYHILTY